MCVCVCVCVCMCVRVCVCMCAYMCGLIWERYEYNYSPSSYGKYKSIRVSLTWA